jgi:GT2 family glycosyltransferase
LIKNSIITVCYNSSNLIDKYISSFLLWNCSYQKKIEFIFIDNSREKKLVKKLQPLINHGFKVRLIKSKNIGFGKACNLGAQKALGQNLLFINPDIQFLSSIENIINLLRNKIWGTCFVKSNLSFQSLVITPEKNNFLFELFKLHRILYLFPKILISKFIFFTDSFFVNGCFLVIKKKFFFKAGKFNENFFLYFEDVELSERLKIKYGLPFLCTSVIVEHKSHGSTKNYKNLTKLESKGFLKYIKIKNRKYLLKKYTSLLKIVSFFYPKYKIRYQAYSKLKIK